MLAIKDYADTTWAGMLDELTELPFEMTVTQSFMFDERAVALEKLNRQGRVMEAAQDAAASQRNDCTRRRTIWHPIGSPSAAITCPCCSPARTKISWSRR